ncbi:phage tail protein [Acinetobacter baumannii]|nr:phage tail protein [Acinetobacter baumannii]
MTKQTINVGSAANDGSGTPARTAFQYINANFSEVYDFLTGTTNGTTIPAALPITKGGTGATSASGARTNLGLGSAATQNKSRAFLGVGSAVALGASSYTESSEDGQYIIGFNGSEPTHPPVTGTGYFIPVNDATGATGARFRFAVVAGTGNNLWFQERVNSTAAWNLWHKIYTTRNTSVDSNGFIKAASPIVQLFADKIEMNDEAQQQNITFEKVGVGDYLIKGSTGFAQEGWYIETPKDANGNILFAVIYQQLENKDIEIKTFKKKFDVESASIIADLDNPVDISMGRWIDIRLQEIPKPVPEMPVVTENDTE